MAKLQAIEARAMPLNEPLAEMMNTLKSTPDLKEILEERSGILRGVEARAEYDATPKRFNDAISEIGLVAVKKALQSTSHPHLN